MVAAMEAEDAAGWRGATDILKMLRTADSVVPEDAGLCKPDVAEALDAGWFGTCRPSVARRPRLTSLFRELLFGCADASRNQNPASSLQEGSSERSGKARSGEGSAGLFSALTSIASPEDYTQARLAITAQAAMSQLTGQAFPEPAMTKPSSISMPTHEGAGSAFCREQSTAYLGPGSPPLCHASVVPHLGTWAHRQAPLACGQCAHKSSCKLTVTPWHSPHTRHQTMLTYLELLIRQLMQPGAGGSLGNGMQSSSVAWRQMGQAAAMTRPKMPYNFYMLEEGLVGTCSCLGRYNEKMRWMSGEPLLLSQTKLLQACTSECCFTILCCVGRGYHGYNISGGLQAESRNLAGEPHEPLATMSMKKKLPCSTAQPHITPMSVQPGTCPIVLTMAGPWQPHCPRPTAHGRWVISVRQQPHAWRPIPDRPAPSRWSRHAGSHQGGRQHEPACCAAAGSAARAGAGCG
ncbi:hypothetical protein HaLaN_28454 [Haematococcus lacustris]|uniref:Uncharacterized protein n=1 Tax=Haematococcus lacustris TaxID=44745 RepID=A0A6A0AAG0_HAELA|nr:hypothetical protein HaLaN_28454 [Haematococcus lacustris]